MEQAVSVLTHIRGNTNDGESAFNKYCINCHKSENSGIPTLDLLKKDKPEEYDLALRPYATTVDDLPNSCSKIVIIAFTGTSLHIRIFDADGKKVVDKAESTLTNGEALTTLKELLHNYSNGASLSQEKKQELRQKIIQKATLITGYTHREKIIRGILYPNPHWATRNGPEYMENGITTRMPPQEFIDVVEYLDFDKNGVGRIPNRTLMQDVRDWLSFLPYP